MVDYIRRPYSTLARFFKDDEGPPVIIQWYAAAPDAPTLERGTSFMALDWTSSTDASLNPNWPDEPWLQRPGEMFEAARPFSPWPTPLGLDYAHVCGTEAEFIDGAVFDPDLEVKYDEQGLPLCCNGPIVPVFALEVEFDGQLVELIPGTNCADATPLSFGEWFVFSFTTEPPFQFTFTFDGAVSPNNYRLRAEFLEGDPSGSASAQWQRRTNVFPFPNCANLNPPNLNIAWPGPPTSSDGTVGLFALQFGWTLFLIPGSGGPFRVRFRVDDMGP